MDGIINLCKPGGITSAKALYRVRAITQQRKSGHAGTLDPAASGVLVICMGKATKLVEAVMNLPKVYRAVARLDVTSESLDRDRPLLPVEARMVPTLQDIQKACPAFVGSIEQVPPDISAVKVGGTPAYKLAACDDRLQLRARTVHVYWLHVHSYAWPTLDFELCCGRGTYVRAIVRDLGMALGTGGCLMDLSRRRVGPFRVEEAWTLEALARSAGPQEYLLNLAGARAVVTGQETLIPPPSDAKPVKTGR